MSLSFYHLAYLFDFMINIIILLRYFTPSTKNFAGLNAGMLCAGILLLYFRNISSSFSALVLTIKLPKPLKYTLSPVL
jgi:hypothetical protein